MKQYVSELVPENVQQFFDVVAQSLCRVEKINLPEGREVTCHALTRAVALRFSKAVPGLRLRTEDGLYNAAVAHSWIRIESTQGEGYWILDVYPVAMKTYRGTPTLHEANTMFSSGALFAPNPLVERKLKQDNPLLSLDVRLIGDELVEKNK